jgi:hypothetical protein
MNPHVQIRTHGNPDKRELTKERERERGRGGSGYLHISDSAARK